MPLPHFRSTYATPETAVWLLSAFSPDEPQPARDTATMAAIVRVAKHVFLLIIIPP